MHSFSSCPLKCKTQIYEYCRLSIYHRRILYDIENSTKGRKRNFSTTMNSEKTPHTSLSRASNCHKKRKSRVLDIFLMIASLDNDCLTIAI